MITLKEIKRYPDTNSVEATWVDGEVVVKCHSYDQVQMDMLAADLGTDLAEYQWIIDEVQANMLPVPEPDLIAIETQRIASLWQAAHDYEYAQISGSAIGLLAMGVMQGKPKCIAVQNWIKTIWTEYYTRKANGSTNYDYSFAGAIPYTVPEIIEEMGV